MRLPVRLSARPRTAAAVCALLVLTGPALAACGSSSGSASASSTTGRSATAAPSGGLPGVSGSYGQKPTLRFPSAKAPAGLKTKVLHQGTGPVVAKGDLLVADYLGQVWNGKVFDNSYDRKQPAGFQIGAGKVIPGWDETLVGQHAGSRVLLVIPSDKGYGAQGQPQAGIPGGATLVFVVDIVGSYNKSAGADPHAAKQPVPAHLPVISGPLTAEPKVTVPKGTPAPKAAKVVVLDKGTGPAVKTGLLVAQYTAVFWTGQSAGSTWQEGAPAGIPLGQGSPFDALVGVPVGSRVLLEIPASSANGQKQPAVAVDVDVVAQPASAGA